jgi:hypothetical protein
MNDGERADLAAPARRSTREGANEEEPPVKKQSRPTQRRPRSSYFVHRTPAQRHIDAILDTVSLTDEVHDALPRVANVARALARGLAPYRRGSKQGRKMALRRIVESIVAEGVTDPSAVFNRLEELAPTGKHPELDDVLKRREAAACGQLTLKCAEDYHVHWWNARGHRLRTTGFKAIRNMVSSITNS